MEIKYLKVEEEFVLCLESGARCIYLLLFNVMTWHLKGHHSFCTVFFYLIFRVKAEDWLSPSYLLFAEIIVLPLNIGQIQSL